MFGSKPAPRGFAAAKRDIRHERADVRAEAAADLARHAASEPDAVRQALVAALSDGHAQVRAAAALGLADAEALAAIPDLIKACRDDALDVRQMALVALGELRAKSARAAVERGLKDDQAAVRFQAVIAYPRVCDERPRALNALLRASRDEDALVRHIALRMGEELGGDDDNGRPVEPAILKRALELLDDDHPKVRVAAAVIIGRSGREEGNNVLVEAAAKSLGTDDIEDEAAAIELCGELGLHEATRALVHRGFGRLLQLRPDPFAWQARVALATLGHERAIRWVLSELTAWTRERRSLAVAAAMRAKLLEARPILEAMRGDDSRADPEVVQEALDTLDSAADSTQE